MTRLTKHISCILRLGIPLFLCASTTGCVTEQPNYLSYACNDVVVVGRIKTISITPVADPEPLANWRSQYDLKIEIKRVLRGADQRSEVSATAIAHAQIREDRDFLIVLSPDGAGSYRLETASLWPARARLQRTCR